MRRHGHESGYFTADAVIGLSIVGMLIGLLTSAIAGSQHAAESMRLQRQLDRLAESALTDLKRGQEPTLSGWDEASPPSMTFRVLNDAAPTEASRWIEVDVEFEGRAVSLIGSVPEGSVKLIGVMP